MTINVTGTGSTTLTTDTTPVAIFPQLSIADDSTDPVTASVSMDLQNGTFGNLGDGSVDLVTGNYNITGSPTDVQAALSALTFVPDSPPDASSTTTTFTLNLSDDVSSGYSGTTDATVFDVASDAGPTILNTLGGQTTTDQQTVDPFTTAFLVDNTPNATDTLTISYEAPNGYLIDPNTSDGSVSDMGSGTYTVTGTAADLQTDLRDLMFVPAAEQVPGGQSVTTDFAINLSNDSGAATSDDSTTVTATSSGYLPEISGTVADQTINDHQTATPFSTATVSDADPTATLTATVTYDPTNGSLADPNAPDDGATIDTSSGSYIVTGTADQITADLQGLTFTPTANQVPAGNAVTTEFDLTVDDGVTSNPPTDTTTSVVATAVGDLPTITGTEGGQAYDGTELSPFSQVSLSDPTGGEDTLTITADRAGTLANLAGFTADDTGTVYTATGTAADLTAALDGIIFQPPNAAYDPAATITTDYTISLDNGTGSPATDSNTSVTFMTPQNTAALAHDTGASGSDGITSDPTLTGTTDPSASVEIYSGGSDLGAAPVDTNTGAWTFTPQNLSDGPQTFTVQATGSNGVADNTYLSFNLLTSAPATPTVAVPASGSLITGIATPEVQGTAADGDSVTVLVDGAADGNAVADPNTGDWTYTLANPLSVGSHQITAVATDVAGNNSAVSAPLMVDELTPPVDGTVTLDESSRDCAGGIAAGGVQWAPGTEYAVLTDGTLSVGPDTNEAFLARLYVGVLDRPYDESGLSYWDQALGSGSMSKGAVADVFLSTPEGQAETGSLTDQQFVQSLYGMLLGRTGSSDDVNYWANALGQGASRGDVLAGFADSDEAKQHLAGATSQVFVEDPTKALIDRSYEIAFNRHPDMAGLQYWQGQFGAGMTPDQFAQSIVTSPEFQSETHGLSDSDVVSSFYHTALGRAPATSEQSYWADQLQSGSLTQAQMLIDFAQSREAYAYLGTTMGSGTNPA